MLCQWVKLLLRLCVIKSRSLRGLVPLFPSPLGSLLHLVPAGRSPWRVPGIGTECGCRGSGQRGEGCRQGLLPNGAGAARAGRLEESVWTGRAGGAGGPGSSGGRGAGAERWPEQRAENVGV
jgi:hypothetical protein